MDENSKGKFENCIIDYCGREAGTVGEPLIYQRKDGTIVANLDGWALMPVDDYNKLKPPGP